MEKISKKQITLIYVGILIYMLVASLVEDGLKRIPDIHWIVVGVVPIVAGFFALKLFARKEFKPISYFKGKNKMTPDTFFRIFCGFCILLLIGAVLQNGIEMGLGFFGLSSTGRLDSIFESMFEENQTWSIISIVLVAPVEEELICRGYAAHTLERGGKKFAIVLSALLFAMMHANIIQGVNTFVMALMLGYVALEYSIFWSMVLHFINNGVFAVGFALLVGKLFPDMTVTGASFARYGVEGGFAVIGIILIVKDGGIARIKAYMAENAPEKGTWKKAFFNVIFIIAVIAVMLLSIFMIGPV